MPYKFLIKVGDGRISVDAELPRHVKPGEVVALRNPTRNVFGSVQVESVRHSNTLSIVRAVRVESLDPEGAWEYVGDSGEGGSA